MTVAKHSYTYDALGNIATWKREAPLANPTGLTRRFTSQVFYDNSDQVSSVIHTPLAGSSVVESAQHYVYDAAGNIASKQVETPVAASTMVPYTSNSLNQITKIGGSTGTRLVTVRGTTSEPAKVKAKTSIASERKNARLLEGNRCEADLDLANGANTLQLQAKDGSNVSGVPSTVRRHLLRRIHRCHSLQIYETYEVRLPYEPLSRCGL